MASSCGQYHTGKTRAAGREVPIEFCDRDVETKDVVTALQRDGAVVVREQVEPEITEKVKAGG